MNQALVNSKGIKVSAMRPDIQYIQGGKVHIEEVIVTNPGEPNRGLQMESALGADFGSYFPWRASDITGP
jgi:hypothetical protein